MHTLGMMKNKFVLCGILGWCMEIVFTGLGSLRRHEHNLSAHTSIWMFPIYGMACFFLPVSRLLKGRNFLVRGGVYTCCIFGTEYLCGSLLRRHGACPWDYSRAKYNVRGLIRLDYAPYWFAAGLIFEKILRKDSG